MYLYAFFYTNLIHEVSKLVKMLTRLISERSKKQLKVS